MREEPVRNGGTRRGAGEGPGVSSRLPIRLLIAAALGVAVVALFLGASSAPLDEATPPSPPEARLYSFFVAGHVYGSPGGKGRGVHPPFRKRWPLLRSDPLVEFGVLTGDVVRVADGAHWDALEADLASLEIPIHFAIGNHEAKDRELFRSRAGDSYFAFTHHGDLFVVLDPLLDGWSIRGAQLDFLAGTLRAEAPTADNVFVFVHPLIWREPAGRFADVAWNSAAGRVTPVNFWSDVAPLLRATQKPVYLFAGDLGAGPWSDDLQYAADGSLQFIATGMGDGDGDNFVLVDVDEHKTVSFRLIALQASPTSMGRLEDDQTR